MMNDDKEPELEQEPIGLQEEQKNTAEEEPAVEGEKDAEPETGEEPEAVAPEDGQVVDQNPESVAEDELSPESSDVSDAASVEYEGERPIVRDLEYQVPRGKASEDDEDTQVERFESVAEAKAVAEGYLFSSNEPLSVQKLSRLMSNLHPKTVRGLLLELQWDYDNRHGALQIIEIAGGYQMSTRPFVAPWMFRMHKHKRRSALSPATLETLAIIAYRQPITKGEIETIRGVESGAPLRTLQELNLVEVGGRKEVIGRPQMYITGDLFLKTFGLKSMADLPSISELKTRFMDEQKLKPVVAVQSENEGETSSALEEPAVVEPESAGEESDLAAEGTDKAVFAEEAATDSEVPDELSLEEPADEGILEDETVEDELGDLHDDLDEEETEEPESAK